MYQSAVVTLCSLMMYGTLLCHVCLCVTLSIGNLLLLQVRSRKLRLSKILMLRNGMRFVIHTQCVIHVDLNGMRSSVSVSEGIVISLALEAVLLAILALLI